MAEIFYKEESFKIVGPAMEVHSVLGRGFSEPIFHEAFMRELTLRNIPFQSEKELTVEYKGEPLTKTYRADFVAFEKIIVELKAVKQLLPEHRAQVFNYLRATGFKLGLLINFGGASLETERIVVTPGN